MMKGIFFSLSSRIAIYNGGVSCDDGGIQAQARASALIVGQGCRGVRRDDRACEAAARVRLSPAGGL